MSRFAVILPAAGSSTRMTGFQKKKPYIDLKGRPIWVRTAEHFLSRDDVCQTILVVAPDDLEWFRETYRANLAFMDLQVVTGCASRAESVLKGLQAVRPEADYIAVHDAARPLLTAKWIDEVFAEHAAEAARFTSGEKKLQGVLVGLVMKKSNGSADHRKVNQLLAARGG